MLMVFGIKSNETGDELSIAGKLDPRQLKKNPMTGFQLKMQQELEKKKQERKVSSENIQEIEKLKQELKL